MKMMSKAMFTLLGGMGVFGYFYFKEHPEVMQKLMRLKKEEMNTIKETMKES